MNRIPFFSLLLAVFVFTALALTAPPAAAQQKTAYVDIAYIMKQIPEAQEAQSLLDGLVDRWQKELRGLEDEWQAKFNDYDKRKLILTDQGRAKAEQELQDLDRRIMDFRDQKFGQNGELFAKEDELMKPIQNMVFDQVSQLAQDRDYDYVFDKSGGVMIIYANEKHDLTEDVVKQIKTMLPARDAPSQDAKGSQQGGEYSPPPSSSPPSGSQQPPSQMPPPEQPRK